MKVRFVLLLCLCFLLGRVSLAQTGVGELQGTVTDATGVLLPGAPLALENVQTGNSFQTTSNEVGFFLFPSLQPSEYRLTINFVGMDKWQGQVILQMDQRAVVNPVLKVGRTADEVTVVGDVTPLVSMISPTVATTVER